MSVVAIEETTATARAMVARAGARITPWRVKVLAVLMAAHRPLSHLDVLAELESGADRVTVYRVLEWLTEVGLAHKLSGDDRVWRFSVTPVPHSHAHFHCQVCGRFFCLEEVSTDLPVSLPSGFAAQALEITVKGICADCR
ncbi:transcriptional repressor [Chitiniphilus purpureus]|uniref:Transcriptional repressor n=1 Tax=Chitiniphilus purpureus TaxID=2981137 RepID=A0ABY6DMW2_9NEIS|nr:Fur family transcriptional regulator [Chitiniphilus sp. CD1]UXY15676.1 transcriptional repressor [Chitiniphilus sp. CD1]